MISKVCISICMILLFVSLPVMLFAGTTGKIAGYVRDVSTGEPLGGTNIMLEGTTMGAAADMKGYFVILNIPPGNYTLKATMIGFKDAVFENVRVFIDLTTAQDIYLEPTVIKGEVVTVTAERPLIEQDITSSRTIIESEMITEAPLAGLSQAVALTPGFSVGSPRGGRRNQGEIAYIVDGLDLNSPLGTARVGYSPGQSTADGLATDVVELGLEEVEVLMGGFGAEYYQAPSAIVNVVTKEGGPNYSARLRYKVSYDVLGLKFLRPTHWISRKDWFEMDKLVGQKWLDAITDTKGPTYTDPTTKEKRYVQGRKISTDYDINDLEFSFSGPVPIAENMGFPGRLYWIFNGNVINNRGRWRTNVDKLETYEGKLTYISRANKKLSIGIRISESERRFYSTGSSGNISRVISSGDRVQSWIDPTRWYTIPDVEGPGGDTKPVKDYDLNDNLSRPKYRSNQISLNYTVPVSPTTFYEINAQRFYTGQKRFTYDPWDGSPLSLDEFSETRLNPSGVRFDGIWDLSPNSVTNQRQIDGQTIWQLKGSLSSQVNPHHLVKMGLEFKKYDVSYDRTSYASGGNLYNSQYLAEPIQAGGYIQDRIETKGMIVNVGMRFDYFDPKYLIPWDLSDPIKEELYIKEVTGENIYDIENRYKNPVDADKKYQFSPRIGISHPILDNATLHFTYGHFFTLPPYDDFYTNTAYDMRGAFKYIGNPNLKHQKTISYETGVEFAFTDFMKMDVTAFYKDMADLINAQRFENPTTGGVFWVFTNADYATSKGIEISLLQRRWYNLSGQLNYTYQIARGKNSYYFQAFSDDYNNRKPRTEDFPLDWDVRHTLNAQVDYQTDADWGPTLFGIKPFGDWRLNMVFSYISGRPYSGSSRVSPPQHPPINNKRLPAEWNLDLYIDKDFRILDSFSAGFFVEVYNVFDHRNLTGLDNVERYEVEGDPDGQWNIPDVWSAPRRVLFGIDLKY